MDEVMDEVLGSVLSAQISKQNRTTAMVRSFVVGCFIV